MIYKKEFLIDLSTIDKVKRFITKMSASVLDADICSDNHYIVDAKSIMGIFSLDLSKPVTLRIYGNEDLTDKDFEPIKEFIIQ